MEGTCARIEQLSTESTRPALRYTAAALIEETRDRFLEAQEALYQLY
jgi:hypothetical protein